MCVAPSTSEWGRRTHLNAALGIGDVAGHADAVLLADPDHIEERSKREPNVLPPGPIEGAVDRTVGSCLAPLASSGPSGQVLRQSLRQLSHEGVPAVVPATVDIPTGHLKVLGIKGWAIVAAGSGTLAPTDPRQSRYVLVHARIPPSAYQREGGERAANELSDFLQRFLLQRADTVRCHVDKGHEGERARLTMYLIGPPVPRLKTLAAELESAAGADRLTGTEDGSLSGSALQRPMGETVERAQERLEALSEGWL